MGDGNFRPNAMSPGPSLGPGDIVLGTQLPKKGHSSPQFSAHVYYGQTAGWIKIPLGTEVGLGPGHVVLYGEPPPFLGEVTPPIFGPCLLWSNGWMNWDAT